MDRPGGRGQVSSPNPHGERAGVEWFFPECKAAFGYQVERGKIGRYPFPTPDVWAGQSGRLRVRS